MQKFLAETQPSIGENPRLGVLRGYVDGDRCWRLRHEDKVEDARRACNEALRFGDDIFPLTELSYLFDAKKQPLELLPILDRALRLVPQDRTALARRFLARAQDHATYLGAADDMIAARRVDPMSDLMQKNFVFMATGLLLDGRKLADAGKHEEAIRYFERGLVIAPGDHNLVPALAASQQAIAGVRSAQ